MRKLYFIGLICIIIVFSIILILLFSGTEKKDIEVTVSDIRYENNQYFINLTIKNNQNTKGWIFDIYLLTNKERVIDLTGAGIDNKIEPGETIEIQLFSTEIYETSIDPPLKIKYTVFPSGNSYLSYI